MGLLSWGMLSMMLKRFVVFLLIVLGCNREKPKPATTFSDALRETVNNHNDLPRFVFLFDPRNKERITDEDFLFLSRKVHESVQKNVFDNQAKLCLEILGRYTSLPVVVKDQLRKDIIFLLDKDPDIASPNGGSMGVVSGVKIMSMVGNNDDVKWLSKIGNKGDFFVQKAVVDAIMEIKKKN